MELNYTFMYFDKGRFSSFTKVKQNKNVAWDIATVFLN